MNVTTDFDSFLDGVETSDIEEIHSLKNCIEEEENCGPFTIKKKGNQIFVSICTNDVVLRIASEKAKRTILKIIESRYGGELGIEGERDYQRQMLKD